jgi:GntR family transcriptional regulator
MTATKEPQIRLHASDIGAPLHHQIFAILRSGIVAGRYGLDELLPSESELKGLYGVSRATVRRAMLTLEKEGLIERRQGRGTRVVHSPPPAPFTSGMVPESTEASKSRILEFDNVTAPAQARALFGLPEGAKVLRIKRVRETSAGLPLRLLVYCVAEVAARDLSRGKLRENTLLADLEQLGYIASRATEIIGATLADPNTAASLQVKVGAPLLELERHVFDKDGVPLLHQLTLIPPERHRMRIEVPAGILGLPNAGEAGELRPLSGAAHQSASKLSQRPRTKDRQPNRKSLRKARSL